MESPDDLNSDQIEFNDAIREIIKKSFTLDSITDRVMCSEWICKLIEMPEKEGDAMKLKNDYIQYLKLMVDEGLLHGPFKHMPPENYLIPLPEYLGRLMCDSTPELPKSGAIAPVISHISPDGRAHLSAQKIPGGGIFCYMAVSPDGL